MLQAEPSTQKEHNTNHAKLRCLLVQKFKWAAPQCVNVDPAALEAIGPGRANVVHVLQDVLWQLLGRQIPQQSAVHNGILLG